MFYSGKIKIKTRRAIYQSGKDVEHPPTRQFKAQREEAVRALHTVIVLIACESDEELRKCYKHIIDRILCAFVCLY